MLINSEGRPAILCAVLESDSDAVLWQHMFCGVVLLDSKLQRATVTAVCAAHNIEAVYCVPLKKRR